MSTPISGKDVLFFVPNLIGYTRVVASFFSFFLMIFSPDQWLLAIVSYVYSFAADLFDGMAARKFDQCSSFGGLLDMVTDRCSTLGLLFILYGEYGAVGNDFFGIFRMIFLLLALLDISSHWCQQFSTAYLKVHHKSEEANKNRFFLVRWYYQIYPFFGYCCVSAETTYITMFILAHSKEGLTMEIASMILKFCVPGCAMKQIVNVFQLCSACKSVADFDAQTRNKKQ